TYLSSRLTGLPLHLQKYVEQLLEHRYIVLCGEQGLGKSYLATKLAEHVVQRIACKASPAVAIFNVAQATRKELNKNLASLIQNDAPSFAESRPAVVVLDQLNCLASLADVFDLSLLEKNENCPYIIGVRDKSRKGPFSPKELSLSHYFRWLRVSLKDRQYSGLLGRFLRRQLSWSQLQNKAEGDDLLQFFDWLTKVWYHLNGILEEYCEPDTTIGEHIGPIVVHYLRAV
ncbi:PREDICTED: neuron navigator 3-like, partial [Acropora digitifera]|uniref:neuron navigator 3-like n=1 Tax=Acropora digitifera TaxID=70779 RepID=UPI00077A3826